MDRGVAVSAAPSTGELLSVPGLGETTVRSIHAAGWGRLATRLEEKAPGRVEKIDPAYTSQICHACDVKG